MLNQISDYMRIPVFTLIVSFIIGGSISWANPEITITDPWVREAPPQSSVSAAYMIIENSGTTDDKLIEIKSALFKKAEIHKTTVDENGTAKMQMVENIELKPGEKVEFKPGGLHIMLIQPTEKFGTEKFVELVLVFENSGNKVVKAEVLKK